MPRNAIAQASRCSTATSFKVGGRSIVITSLTKSLVVLERTLIAVGF